MLRNINCILERRLFYIKIKKSYFIEILNEVRIYLRQDIYSFKVYIMYIIFYNYNNLKY